MKKAYLVGAVIALSATFVDQITKYLAVKYIAGEVYQEGIFSLQLGSNSGIAFGLNVPALITVVLSIIFMFVGVYLAKNHLDITKKSAVLLTGLVLGGALGNLIDRICTGKVIDFIGISIWPLFNFADICITVGIFSIVIFYDKLKKTNK